MDHPEQIIGIFTTDANLIIRSWGTWLARVTTVPPETAVGQALAALFPEIETRGLLTRFQRVMTEGVVEVLAPAFHHYLIPCAPESPSKHFDQMQQRVTIAPLRENERIVGAIVTIVDVTARLDYERELAEQLSSPDEATRLKAAQTLAEDEALESTPKLIGALGDESWRVRQAAVSGLTPRAEPETIAALLRLLREEHRNLSVLNSALEVLVMSDVDIISPLTEFLRDPDVDLRIQAALALGERRDLRAVPALLQALEDADANVRYHAIEALGKLRAAEAVEALVVVAESRDFFLAFPALDALTRIGETRVASRLVPLLEDELLRGPAADALGQLGDEEVVEPLAKLLNTPGAPSLLIAQAFATLHNRYEDLYREGTYIADLARGVIAATGAQNLLDVLDEANADELRALALVLGWLEGVAVERALTRLLGKPSARKEVVEALVRYGERVTDLLIEQLEAEDLETRRAAVIALGRIGNPESVPALLRVLTEDDELMIVAAGALAKLGDPRAFETLLSMVGHRDAAVRQAVIAAINSLGHPEMPARAVVLLNDPDPYVRESVVRIAGYFGFTECVDLLVERCRDANENVRRAAIEHLPYLEDERALPILIEALRNEAPRVRAAAAQALAQVDDKAVITHLIAALNDSDSWVRYFAACSIGRQGDAAALDALAELAQTDAPNHVRIAALEALGRIGGVRAVAILAPFIERGESDLAQAAVKALGSIGHPNALPPLQAAVQSHDSTLRVAALRALGKRGGDEVAEALQWVAATDADAEVTQAAIDALAHLATPEAIDALVTLTADHKHREACIAALSRFDEAQLEWIAHGLTHANVEVRRAVTEALGRIKRSSASELLSAALDDPEATVRLAAANALGYLGNRRAERKLVALVRTDPDMAVRRAAEKALGK